MSRIALIDVAVVSEPATLRMSVSNALTNFRTRPLRCLGGFEKGSQYSDIASSVSASSAVTPCFLKDPNKSF